MAKIWELILIFALAGMIWIVRMDKKAETGTKRNTDRRKNKDNKGKESDDVEGTIQSE